MPLSRQNLTTVALLLLALTTRGRMVLPASAALASGAWKAPELADIRREHSAELWCPRPSSLKLQETKDDRSFLQWYTMIRLWRLPWGSTYKHFLPNQISPAKYPGRGTPVWQSLPLFLFNPIIIFQITREVCREYVVSLHLDESMSIKGNEQRMHPPY